MLPKSTADIVAFSPDLAPRLVCIIDAEEEFDWAEPFSSRNNSVKTIKAQISAQRIFDRFKLMPTYAVDYPVASQEDGYGPLREFVQSGLCEIGAQLHPWVTPPYDELVSDENSFAYNLPVELQRKKIATLTDAIVSSFGVKPKVFRTGRYGAGAATIGLLREFSYEIDCSVLPGPPIASFSPDYSQATSMTYWLDDERCVLEIPVTAGTVGPLRILRGAANIAFSSAISKSMKIPAILARTGMLNRIRLTPEGNTLSEAKALTRALFREGQRVFAISYHSPSLEPGKTPYTHNQRDVARFLSWIEGYIEFFLEEMNGRAATPGEVRQLAASIDRAKTTEEYLA